MSSLSTHVLDVERGTPARGVPVALYRGEQLLEQAETNADGRVSRLANDLDADAYRIVFDVAAYFANSGRTAPFLRSVSLEFQVDPADTHYHIPLLLSPYACTSYRGS